MPSPRPASLCVAKTLSADGCKEPNLRFTQLPSSYSDDADLRAEVCVCQLDLAPL
jgi:hypothetical protein